VVWVWLRREPLDLRRRWRRYLVQGLLGAALPFALIAAAEVRLWLTPAALVTLPSAPPSVEATLSLLALALLSTTFAVAHVLPPHRTRGRDQSDGGHIPDPYLGVVLGALVLREPVRPGLVAGLVPILVGVALVLEVGRRDQIASAAAAD
jgi:drug/metabolite transporter (DMT)-like permease